MKKSFTAERRNEIAQQLLKDGNIKVGELADKFNVSTETIRKDIIYLEEQGLAQKSYGGAIASKGLLERPVSVKEIENMDIKSDIALAAMRMIPNNSIILLDAGSTTYALAKLLSLKSDLTIFTNSVNIMNLLCTTNNKVFCFGGQIRGSSKASVGDWAIQELSTIRIDVAFMGTDGFQNFDGPSTASFEESQFKRAIVDHSDKTIVLTDNSKFTNTSLFRVCEWNRIYALITNESNDENYSKLKEKIEKQTTFISC